MNKIVFYVLCAVVLIVGVVIWFVFKRNYFNKYKYIRVERWNEDKSVSVNYYKRDVFNQNGEILINPEHVFICRGYTSILLTSKTQETINPLDFESKYSAKDFKSGMRSKLVKDAFDSIKVEKFDKVMALIALNIIQLLAIAYLLYTVMGGAK